MSARSRTTIQLLATGQLNSRWPAAGWLAGRDDDRGRARVQYTSYNCIRKTGGIEDAKSRRVSAK